MICKVAQAQTNPELALDRPLGIAGTAPTTAAESTSAKPPPELMTTETATNAETLSEEEFDRLESFLDGLGPPAMNLEELDGFFVALVSGPLMVMPGEYLPQIWGDRHEFSSDAQAGEILDLLFRHWNNIASTLLRTLTQEEVYMPVLHESADGSAPGNSWAKGFMRAMQMRAQSWRELLDSEEHGGSLLPIMMLAHEHDPDPEMRHAIEPERHDEVLQMMIAGVTRIYRYFEPHRRAGNGGMVKDATLSARRAGPKVGRNDPCPCGSGKKYKLCCAPNAPTLH